MRGSIRRRLLQGGIAAAASGVMLGAFVGLSSAAPSHGHSANGGSSNVSASSNVRPGWGCGDTNHVHTGPPGGGGGFNPCLHHFVTSTATTSTTTSAVTTAATTTATTTGTTTTTATTTASSTT